MNEAEASFHMAGQLAVLREELETERAERERLEAFINSIDSAEFNAYKWFLRYSPREGKARINAMARRVGEQIEADTPLEAVKAYIDQQAATVAVNGGGK